MKRNLQVAERFASHSRPHFAKLRDVRETTDTFIERASVMGERLAPALFQLPPDLKLDLAATG